MRQYQVTFPAQTFVVEAVDAPEAARLAAFELARLCAAGCVAQVIAEQPQPSLFEQPLDRIPPSGVHV